MLKPEKKRSEHYVSNKDFSLAVVEYVKSVALAVELSLEIPRITNYIGECFMKIAEGLSHAPNFIRYSYRDEMVMDGVENCVKAISNFDRSIFEARKAKVTVHFKPGLLSVDIEAISEAAGEVPKTVKRWYKEYNGGTGDWQASAPNAFAYFTQISYFAFLRRIAKEKKQYDIKLKYIESAGIGSFADFGVDGGHRGDSLIEKIRGRTDALKRQDDSFIDDDSHGENPPKKAIKHGLLKKPKASTSVSLLDVFDDKPCLIQIKEDAIRHRIFKCL